MDLTYSSNSRVFVYALLQDEAGRVLFIQMQGDKLFSLPGGLVAKRETTADSLKRQVEEQLKVFAGKIRKVAEHSPRKSETSFVYQVLNYTGSLPAEDDPTVLWADPFDPSLTVKVFSNDLDYVRRAVEHRSVVD